MNIMILKNTVFNVDSNVDAERLLAQGARKLTSEEITNAGITNYEHLVSPANTAVREDGSIIFTPPTLPTLAETKAAKIAEINGTAEVTLAAMTASYPQGELLTFDKQEAEARAWLADNTVPTPLLTALAAGRGIALAELVQKVIAKADIFSAVSGYVIGQRQGLEDRLDAAATVKDVQAIEVVLHLPEAAA